MVIGRGRDAVDVALTTHFGATRLREMTVWSDEVVEAAESAPPAAPSADASEAAAAA